MGLKVQNIRAFEPRGERYIRHNPHLADTVGSFEEVDFTVFLPSNQQLPGPQSTSNNASTYQISCSGRRERNFWSEQIGEKSRELKSQQILDNLTVDVDEELYIVGS